MEDKFQNKYRIPSARWAAWDYGQQAAYFVTICTAHRQHHFGEIVDNQMILSEIGQIAQEEWFKTPIIRPDMNLSLEEFVVMPNHIHGILTIGENEFNESPFLKTATFGPQSKNLASILRGYKSAVTTQARKQQIAFDWQARYHDHVIRNHKEFQHIAAYIIQNPSNWEKDCFFPAPS
jgi:putative transposase